MKNKLGIKSRIIISFSIFTIITVNIFIYLLYVFVEKNFLENTYKNINDEFQTITTFIDLQNTQIFSLPKNEIEKINSLNFFFYIGNNDKKLIQNYKLGFLNSNNEEVIFRGDYKGYNIIIGKKISDLKDIQNNFIKLSIILNIFTIIFTVVVSYFITQQALRPLSNLSKFLDNYDINKEQKEITNNYGNSEIGIFTNNLNKFILKIKTIFNNQKDFVQDVSHELKTPLMQIESSLEILENKLTKDSEIEKINKVKEILENINNIISKLGFILRGEEFVVKKEKIDLYSYLKELIKKYEVLAQEKNIEIIIEKKGDLIIENNSYYLDRLFGNIILNSIFYNNGNNKILIIVTTKSVEIFDKGIGINNEDLNKIFNRFYRNNNSNIYYKNGNGLGLTIVKKVCDMFGWKIKVTSQIGVGSQFEVFIK